jgi:hypothetical protein
MSDDVILRGLVATLADLAARVRHLEAAELPAATAGITDHGLLSGLADDDHTQYYNAARHTKAVHDDLKIDADTVDGKHASDLTSATAELLVGIARASADLQLTNTWQDISGCTVDLEIPAGGQVMLIIGMFMLEMQYTSSTTVLEGRLVSAGTARAQTARWQGDAPGEMGTVTMAWLVSPAKGTKTFKLQAKRSASGTGDYCRQAHTAMLWLRGNNLTVTNESSG